MTEYEPEVYKVPKYKPGDLILMKFKLYTPEDDWTDQRFEYRLNTATVRTISGISMNAT